MAAYNVQSCYKFWDITEMLRKGTLPSDADWSALKQSEGYKRKNIPDARWKEFVDNVILVYSAGNEEKIREKMGNDISLRWIVRFATEEDKLKRYIADIAKTDLMDIALVHTRRMLPQSYKNCFPEPTVYFILFDYDANGNSNGVVMDLLVSFDMDTYKPGIFLGHEVFHYALAYCRIKLKRFKYIPEQYAAVFTSINAISEEGTADLIDKASLLFEQHSPYLLKDTFFNIYTSQSTACILKINETLEHLSDKQIEPYTQYNYWRQFMPVSGHIPGLFMSNVIRQRNLENELQANLSNPFSFFYLYNEAAKKDTTGLPMFSKKSIRFLRSLEHRYLK
ncbi:hypothetical protein C7475_1011404 [Chitinophaga sp. S165]|nr:hypothetical protein C7475_1011404 [Chitinophaga sp. S165]